MSEEPPKVVFGTKVGSDPRPIAPRDVLRADRVAEVRCPVHPEVLLAVMTTTKIITSLEEVSSSRSTKPLLAPCGECPDDAFEHTFRPADLRAAPAKQHRHPAVILATRSTGRVGKDGRPST